MCHVFCPKNIDLISRIKIKTYVSKLLNQFHSISVKSTLKIDFIQKSDPFVSDNKTNIFEMPLLIFASPHTVERTTFIYFKLEIQQKALEVLQNHITVSGGGGGDFLWSHWQIYYPDVHKWRQKSMGRNPISINNI